MQRGKKASCSRWHAQRFLLLTKMMMRNIGRLSRAHWRRVSHDTAAQNGKHCCQAAEYGVYGLVGRAELGRLASREVAHWLVQKLDQISNGILV
jgi:hypothetical protein